MLGTKVTSIDYQEVNVSNDVICRPSESYEFRLCRANESHNPERGSSAPKAAYCLVNIISCLQSIILSRTSFLSYIANVKRKPKLSGATSACTTLSI